MARKVLLNDNDITQYVSAIPPIKNEMSQPGQVAINDIQTITGANTTGFWDKLSTGSPFNGQDLTEFKLEIYEDTGAKYFEGQIKNIIADNSGRTSQVQVRSNLQIALERGCLYVSAEPETPAQAVQNILTTYGLEVESGSFAGSGKTYTDADIFVVCRLIDPEMTMMQALQTLADIGCASISSIGGSVRFDAYRYRSGTPTYTFTDEIDGPDGVTLWSQPNISDLEKTRIDGYNIETAIAPAVTGSDLKQGKSIQAGNEAPITLVSQQAGVGVGELWIEYSNRAQTFVEWNTRLAIGRDMVLGDPFALRYTQRDWEEITVDVVSVDNSNQLYSRIRGITR